MSRIRNVPTVEERLFTAARAMAVITVHQRAIAASSDLALSQTVEKYAAEGIAELAERAFVDVRSAAERICNQALNADAPTKEVA